MNKTFHVVFGGIVAALCVVLMLLTGLFPFATVALPAIAGVLMIPLVVELGVKWALLVYVVVAAITAFITPDPSSMLMFVFFFGYYPIVKSPLERLPNRVLEWGVKFLVFNTALVVLFLMAQWLFGLEAVLPSLAFFGQFTLPAFWLGLNVIFFLYDFALTRLASVYLQWFRPNFINKLRRGGR